MSTNARGRRTIAAIEDAALDVADAIGYENATVKDICAQAGVAERVFFNHFATREDAFLGREQPTLDDTRARELISDPRIPLVEGAVLLVRLPPADPARRERRLALIARHPPLLARAHALLGPLREECRAVVASAAARRFPDLTATQWERVARLVVAMAAELLDDPSRADETAVLSAVCEDTLRRDR